MNKKISIIVLVILALLGSFILFYATNLLMYDLGLNFYGFQELSIISSLPLFMIGLAFPLAAMFILKVQKYPNSKRQLVKIYSIVLAVYGFIGVVTSILTGTMVYGSLFAKYPFPGYAFICLLGNLVLLVGALLVRFIFVKKLPEDTETNKVTVKTVFKALGLEFVSFFAFERLGAVIWAVEYAQVRSL